MNTITVINIIEATIDSIKKVAPKLLVEKPTHKKVAFYEQHD